MTDTRLPDHWLLNPVLDKLSDGAWRALTRTLMFCNQQGTDGEIESLYLHHVYPWSDPEPFLQELVDIGWLEKTERGYLVPDWEAKGQSTAAQVALWRENSRLRQQKRRSRVKASQSGGVTADVTRDVGQEQASDRQGQDFYGGTSWPTVSIPGTEEQSNG